MQDRGCVVDGQTDVSDVLSETCTGAQLCVCVCVGGGAVFAEKAYTLFYL